jgi:hypothetical protein
MTASVRSDPIRSDPEPAVKARPVRPRKGFKAGRGSCCPTATTGRFDTGRGPGVAGDGCCCTAGGGGACCQEIPLPGRGQRRSCNRAARATAGWIASTATNVVSQPDVTYGVDLPDAFDYFARVASELALYVEARLISSHNCTCAWTPLSLLLLGRRT